MERNLTLQQIAESFKNSKIVAILGPRQCGKTTIARQYFSEQNGNQSQYFDLEDPLDLNRLEDPMLALSDLKGIIVIDEIQRRPDLFPILRVLADAPNTQQQYLILGSASRELIRQSSESLAGRIHYIEMSPFSLSEVDDEKELWLRGGFPLSYLASSQAGSMQWRQDYIKTYLEQDIPNLGINIAPQNLRRFWMMLCHYHGNILNASEIGNALGVSHVTAQKYVDILSGTYMVRQLTPWYEKISKRQVKSNKVYIRDSGIFHALMHFNTFEELSTHPKIGASWEGFALEEIIKNSGASEHECFFWATHTTAELDLMILEGRKKIGYEFKYSKMPKITKSMQIALNDLKLDELIVIYPGHKKFKLSDKIWCIPLQVYIKGES